MHRICHAPGLRTAPGAASRWTGRSRRLAPADAHCSMLEEVRRWWRAIGAVASVQVKGVPPETHAMLRRWAAAAHRSLQEHRLQHLIAEASTPTADEGLAQPGGPAGGSVPVSEAVAGLRRDRDRRWHRRPCHSAGRRGGRRGRGPGSVPPVRGGPGCSGARGPRGLLRALRAGPHRHSAPTASAPRTVGSAFLAIPQGAASDAAAPVLGASRARHRV